MLDQQYIGVIEHINFSTAWLRPLAVIEEHGVHHELENIEDDFPERGRVPWFNINPTVNQGSLWQFKIREAPSFDPGAGRTDKYTIDGTPERVDRRILANFETAEEAFRELSAGIEANCDERDVPFVSVCDKLLIGPLRMQQEDNGRIILDPSQRDTPVNVSDLSRYQTYILRWNEMRWEILWPPRAVWNHDSQLDWGTDAAVLTRGLRCIRDLTDKVLVNNLGLTRSLISTVSARIASAALSDLDRHRISRAMALIEKAEKNHELAETLVRNVIELPTVQDSIEGAQQAAVERTTAEIKERESEILGNLRTERNQLEAQSSQLHSEIEDLVKELAVAKEELEKFLAEAEKTVHARLDELIEKPGEVIGKSVVLMAAAGKLQNWESTPRRLTFTSNYTKNLSLSDVTGQIRAWAEYYGLAFNGILCLAASILGGQASTISGDWGAFALDAVRHAMFAADRNSLTVVLNPGYLSPLDVIKDAQIYSRQKYSDEPAPALATLDGIDRCAMESVFLPFLEEIDGKNLRDRLWPEHSFAVVGTLSNSFISLPISRRLWDHSNYHDFRRADAEIQFIESKPEPSIGQISNSALQELHAMPPKPGAWRAFVQHLPSLRLATTTVRRADRLEYSLRSLGLDSVAAIENVYCVSLIRDLIDCPEDERKRFLDALPESNVLTRSLALFETEIRKREDQCTIQ